jgi:hypothetical protein
MQRAFPVVVLSPHAGAPCQLLRPPGSFGHRGGVRMQRVIELLKRRDEKAMYLHADASTPWRAAVLREEWIRETGSTSVYQLLGEVP